MRFGIMDLQLSALAPPGMPAEALAAHIANLNHAEIVRDLAAQGFNPIELSGDLALFFPHAFAPSAIEQLAVVKAENGIAYSVHLPLWSVELSTALAPVREGSVKAIVETIKATLPLDPEVYVLHATGSLAAEFYYMQLPAPAKGFVLQQFQAQARKSIQEILSQTGVPSRKIAIENIEFPLDMTLALADELDLSVCLDVGHVMVGFSGPVDIFEALERCLPRLGEVHLHDAPQHKAGQGIGFGKDHRPLGTGDLDVGRFLDRLEEVGFSGPVILELMVDEALTSLEVIRSKRPTLLA